MARLVTLAAVAAATLATSSVAAAPVQLITNGDFETGTFAGWNATALPGSSGDLFIDTPGTTAPLSGFETPANPSGGDFYALTDQTGPGSYVLTQSFAVPFGTSSLTLEFDMFVQNSVEFIVNPGGLDFNLFPNQHARVDILAAGSGPFEDGAAIVSNLLLPTSNSAYTRYDFDLSSLVAGQSYILRFAEVDNQFFFQLGVDNVSLVADVDVPEPAALGLLGLGVLGVVAARCRRTV